MSDNNSHVRVPVTWAVLISAAGVLITWGVNANRLTTLERDSQETRNLTLIHDRQIAEMRAQYAEITRRLQSIDQKLESR